MNLKMKQAKKNNYFFNVTEDCVVVDYVCQRFCLSRENA